MLQRVPVVCLVLVAAAAAPTPAAMAGAPMAGLGSAGAVSEHTAARSALAGDLPGPRDAGVAVRSAIVVLDGPGAVTKLGPVVARHVDRRVAAREGAPDAAVVDASVAAAQLPILAEAERLGVEVISRYTTTANGLLVHATADELERLARVPGVARVEPAPRVRPWLRRSVPFIGADDVAAELGYEGSGSVIAVVDSGIDYTHAAFGGPGTAEAYSAAAAAADAITDTWQGATLFPSARVVGGWDFVGANYTTPELCPPAVEASGRCTSTPHPDPDPLDQYGHGTMVAGIAAGQETSHLYHGVAPGASLVALKVYGPPQGGIAVDEEVDVVVDALEWCARVNLGLPVPGVAPARVDVVNLSLGEPYGQGSLLFDQAVAAASAAGVVVVAAAGNSGDQPYVLSSPSSSPLAVSVAGSQPPGQLQVEARWQGTTERFDAIEGTVTAPLSRMGRLEAGLAWVGSACPGESPIQPLLGKIALIAPGGCSYREKVLSAQSNGGRAVIVFADESGKAAMTGDPAGIALAGVMIDRTPGERLRDALLGGSEVTIVLDPGSDVSDAVWVGSSRGPSTHGALKPDVAAPSSGIVAAAMGAGHGGAAATGTSAGTPHVAGAAAVLVERGRAEGLGLSALDVAALLSNYARPVVHGPGTASVASVAVTRQGAGRVDVLGAARGRFVVRAGEVAGINLGPVASYRAEETFVRRLSLRNLSDGALRVRSSAVLRSTGQQASALSISLPDAPVVVPARGSAGVDVTFRLNVSALADWTVRGRAQATAGLMDGLELDGWIELVPVDAGGEPLAKAPAVHVPFHLLPRRATRAYVTQSQTPAGGMDGRVVLRNLSPHNGWAEYFDMPSGTTPCDPDEPGVAGGIDVACVGARYETRPADPDEMLLTFGVALHDVATIPQATAYEVFLDLDRDGRPDRRLRTGTRRAVSGQGGDDMVVAVGRWDAGAGAVVDERIVGSQPADLHSGVAMFGAPAASLGLTGGAPFDFFLVHRGQNEDWLHATNVDVAPDGATDAGGRWYRFEPLSAAYEPDAWTVGMAGSALAATDLRPLGGGESRPLLLLLPDNPFGSAAWQHAVVVPGAGPGLPPGPRPVYMPLLARTSGIGAKSPAEVLVTSAIEKLAAQVQSRELVKFRTVYDYRQSPDRSPNGQWLYEFDGPEVSHVVFSPETGHPIVEYIRKLATVWEKWEGATRWGCSAQRDNVLISPELADRLRLQFDGSGWQADRPYTGEYDGRPVWRLVRATPDGAASQRFYVGRDGGLPLFASQLEGDVLRPSRTQSYHLYDFNDPNLKYRGLNIPCT